MKLLEDDENIVIVPFCWLWRKRRMEFMQRGYEVIPIPGYQETEGYRAVKIIGKYTDDIPLIKQFSIPIWEDWKLTAKYASSAEEFDTTSGQQMFDHLDDGEKIQALKYAWYQTALDYIKRYFENHPDLLERVKPGEIHKDFYQ